MTNLAHSKFMMEWKAGKKKKINMKNPEGNELWG